MKILKIVGIVILVAGIIFVIEKKDDISNYFNKEQVVEEVTEEFQHGSEEQKPYYQGEIVNFEHGGGYTYIEVKEKTELTFWIAVEAAEVKKGDFIKFRKEMVAKDFKSKTLNKTFDEIMFASDLQYKVTE